MKIVKKVLIGIVIFLVVFLAGVNIYFKAPVFDYYRASEKAFFIPGSNSGYIAQGLCYDDRSDSFMLTGYMKDHSSSPVYVVSRESGKVTSFARLAEEDGSEFTGHAGGMAVRGDYVYVAGSKCLKVYSYDEIMAAGDGGQVKCLGSVDIGADIGVAFMTISDDVIYVGEFYREANYPTSDSHKLTTPSGDYNQALVAAFEFTDSDDNFAIAPNPFAIYSVTDQVQGMAVNDGKIYLSISYGVDFSHILVYDKLSAVSDGTFDYEGEEVPMYFLDSASLISDVKIPPMSEEIEFVDGRMYTNCESASNKYIFGKLTGSYNLYSTDMSGF